MSLRQVVKWRTIDGAVTSAHGYKVTPQLKSLQVTLPIGGLLWSRPVAVLVQKDKTQQRIPIVDATRVAQVVIYIFMIVVMLRWRRIGAGSSNK